ncbi:PqqD family protein [Knoellia sp. CPCC 206450]|uniref:PqqD family protein n=1 Tax=Knoellia tibetensis TaxID=3404798 RepID=UPI003B43641A
MTAYSVPERVAHVERDADGLPQVFLMRLPDGPPVALEGTAALIWTFAAEGEADVATAVAKAVGLPREEIADDVEAYLVHLVETGLLTCAD